MLHRQIFVASFVLLAVMFGGIPASAAPAGHLAGVYIFDLAKSEGSPCVMKLDDNVDPNAPGFHNAWLSGGCESTYSFLTALSGWEEIPGGGIKLVGSEGSTMGNFKRQSAGVYAAVVENDKRRYTLSRSTP